MKKILFVLLVALCSVSFGFGNEFEACVSECKAKNIGNALADFKCPNEECKHLNPNFKDKTEIKSYGGKDTFSIKGTEFTGNKPKNSGGAVHPQ